MSKSNRDQRGRRHSGKKCPESQNGGCAYCVTGDYKTPANRAARAAKPSIIRREIRDALDA